VFWKNKGIRAAGLSFEGLGFGMSGCTFVENEVTGPEVGAALEVTGFNMPGPERCIFAYTRNGYGMGCWDAEEVHCSDSWGNDSGGYSNWCGAYENWGNFSANPLFCGQSTGDFHLMEGSPCLPRNHGGVDCGLVGAFDMACAYSRVERTTWGRLKLLYRGEK
jgi:hypothetical protein